MQSNDTNKSSNRQARDGFFIINLDVWEMLFNKIDEQYKNDDVITSRRKTTHFRGWI